MTNQPDNQENSQTSTDVFGPGDVSPEPGSPLDTPRLAAFRDTLSKLGYHMGAGGRFILSDLPAPVRLGRRQARPKTTDLSLLQRALNDTGSLINETVNDTALTHYEASLRLLHAELLADMATAIQTSESGVQAIYAYLDLLSPHQLNHLKQTVLTIREQGTTDTRALDDHITRTLIKTHPDFHRLTQAFRRARSIEKREKVIRLANDLLEGDQPIKPFERHLYTRFLEWVKESSSPVRKAKTKISETILKTQGETAPDFSSEQRPLSIASRYDHLFATHTPESYREGLSRVRTDVMQGAFDAHETGVPMTRDEKRLTTLYLLNRLEETRRHILREKNLFENKNVPGKDSTEYDDGWQDLLPVVNQVRQELSP